MQQLTEKEAAVLKYIRESMESGPVPSIREICSGLKIKSTSTVHRILLSLEDKGYIERRDNLNRCIRLCQTGTSMQVPLLGTVAAGGPILAAEAIEEYLPFHVQGTGSGDFFALHVRGNSMIEAGILDGDVIFVRRCSTAYNGEIVVALLEDEATVKRFYKEDGRYRLQPENAALEPIFCDQVVILGKVVGLQRLY